MDSPYSLTPRQRHEGTKQAPALTCDGNAIGVRDYYEPSTRIDEYAVGSIRLAARSLDEIPVHIRESLGTHGELVATRDGVQLRVAPTRVNDTLGVLPTLGVRLDNRSRGTWHVFGPDAPRDLEGARLGYDDLAHALSGEWRGQKVQNAHYDGRWNAKSQRWEGGRQVGWDSTLSTAKAVSTLYATADRETRDWMEREFEEAARVAFDRIIAPELTTRLGHGGAEHEQVSVAVCFYLQRLSRANDPQLHVHVIPPNFGWTRDGHAVTIESRWLYEAQLAAGVAFDAEVLRRFREHGYRFYRDKDGDLRAEGVDARLDDNLLSKRADQIEKGLRDPKKGFGLDHYDEASAGQRKAMQAMTRAQHDPTYREDWRDQAVAAGLENAWTTAEHEHEVARTRSLEHDRTDPDHLASRLDEAADASIRTLIYGTSHEEETFRTPDKSHATGQDQPGNALPARHRLVAEVAGHARDLGGGVDDVLAAVARAEDRGATATLERAEHGTGLRDQWSTPEFIDLEWEKVMGCWGRLCDRTGYRVEIPEDVLAGLRDESRAAVHAICSDRQVAVIEGLAGTGKTSVVKAAREAFERAGYRVYGEANLGAPTEELRSRGGIARSSTIALAETHGREIDRNSVVFWDEFQGAGAVQWARLLEHIERSGAKLAIVGNPGRSRPERDEPRSPDHEDAGQHGPVTAGAVGRYLAAVARERAPEACNVMRDIQRQRDPELRRVAVLATTGHGADALREADTKGWVRVTATSDDMRREVAVYIADALRKGSAFAVTGSRAEETAINTAVRDERKARGDVRDEQTYRLGKGKRARDIALGIGDKIAWRRNEYSIGVRTGQRAEVIAINRETGDALIRQEVAPRLDRKLNPILESRQEFDDGRAIYPIIDRSRDIVISRAQLEELVRGKQLWSYDYARTSKRAESATVDRQAVAVHCESKSLTRQFASSGWTRSREELRIWVSGQGIEPERSVEREAPHYPPGHDRVATSTATPRADPRLREARQARAHTRDAARQARARWHGARDHLRQARKAVREARSAGQSRDEVRPAREAAAQARRRESEAHAAYAHAKAAAREAREGAARAGATAREAASSGHGRAAVADLRDGLREEALREAGRRLERDAPGETTLNYRGARERAREARERQRAYERDRVRVGAAAARDRE